jgi:ribosomal-protein-alanine N-acetyltransferase
MMPMAASGDASMVYYVRWMIRNDLAQVMDIETACFAEPWDKEDFRSQLRCRDVIGVVVSDCEYSIYAYAIYWLRRRSIEILNLAVDPALQRMGIGTQLIARLKSKLSRDRRVRLIADVAETNLDAQLFFAQHAFGCTEILRKRFATRDAYRFEFDVRNKLRWHGAAASNRIERYFRTGGRQDVGAFKEER